MTNDTLKEDRAKIIRLHELGFTQRQIARSLKLSLTFVSGILCQDYGRYQPNSDLQATVVRYNDPPR
jgi:hypothetical protein